MALLDYNAFGGMEGKTKQKSLREWRMAEYAKNTRLWDGSLRAYRAPKDIGACKVQFELDKCFLPVCTDSCAAYARSPCGAYALYTLIGGKIAENGRVVGLDRPAETPQATLISGAGQDGVIFRVLCINSQGEYSAPSAVSAVISGSYGAVIGLTWAGCSNYRVEALLTQSVTYQKEIGKDPSQWVIVGDYETPRATIVFRPDTWELVSDGYDPAAYCDPPALSCFIVTEAGFFVGWNGSLLFISERHDPSKFTRAAIKNLHANILNVVTAAEALYVATSEGMFVVQLTPDKDGAVASINRTYENALPIKNTLSLVNSGAMFASRFGLFIIDGRGLTPTNVVSKLLPEEEFERDWLPDYGVVQRGVFYGSTTDKRSWHIDFPSTSGDASEFGKLIVLDYLGKHMVAGRDGALYYSLDGRVFAFDRGDSYLAAEWRSNRFIAPARASFSRYKVVGQNLEGVELVVFVDGVAVFTTLVSNGKICTLPRCVVGLEFAVELRIPASRKEAVINRVQLASSHSELARV